MGKATSRHSTRGRPGLGISSSPAATTLRCGSQPVLRNRTEWLKGQSLGRHRWRGGFVLAPSTSDLFFSFLLSTASGPQAGFTRLAALSQRDSLSRVRWRGAGVPSLTLSRRTRGACGCDLPRREPGGKMANYQVLVCPQCGRLVWRRLRRDSHIPKPTF